MRLLVRTVSGVALLGLLLLALHLGLTALAVLVVAIMAIGLLEFRRLWRGQPVGPSSLVLFPLAGFWLLRYAYPEVPTSTVGLLAAALAGLALALFQRHERHPMAGWALGLGGAVWLGYLPGCILLLYQAGGTSGRGMALVLLAVGVSVLGDSAAYLIGSWIGKHPFAPRVSPAKTWEGAIAGWLVPTLVAGGLLPLVLPALHQPVALAIAAAASAAAIAGDLVESRLKREVGAKDSGRLIPGHGGVLDRIDSLLFVAAVVYSLLGVAHAF